MQFWGLKTSSVWAGARFIYFFSMSKQKKKKYVKLYMLYLSTSYTTCFASQHAFDYWGKDEFSEAKAVSIDYIDELQVTKIINNVTDNCEKCHSNL